MLAPLIPSLPYVPARNVIVIVDQLESSAEFLLHRALSLQLKDGLPCTLVATSNDLAHWSSISARSNLALAGYLSSKALVFIDGTAVVSARARENTKEPPLRLFRFARAVRALCIQNNVALIMLNHTLVPDEPSQFLRDLMQSCHLIISVTPFVSGRSGAVSGEITARPGPLNEDAYRKNDGQTETPVLQYRLTDSGAVFFDKGTAGGVL
ncbi:hypothetical protein BS47DRAFT_1341730 [Hydnum rufescens UP504]|uniref:Uncharacterized protein n=1 Tax=Hydnum rufescens UP504 TaxID=1448309 RepID=A0A9P6DY43_9AGAM|nr:hypothetical protein BS47DRAFT_1341730 [Hydnum rufescens UP504]